MDEKKCLIDDAALGVVFSADYAAPPSLPSPSLDSEQPRSL